MKVIIDNRIVDLTFEMMANEFMSSSNVGQVEFLNACAEDLKCDRWGGRLFCFQAQYITDTPELTDEARDFMKILGEYSEKQL